MEGQDKREFSPAVSVRLVAPGDEGEVLHEIECNGSYSILKVRQELSVQWHQAVEDIQLSYQGEMLSDVTFLHELTSDDAVVLMVTRSATLTASTTALDQSPEAITREEEEDEDEEPGAEDCDDDGGGRDNEGGSDKVGGADEDVAVKRRNEGRDMGRDKGGDAQGGGERGIKEVRLLSMTVDQGAGKSKEVLVKVYDCSVKKPFLGGYREKATQQEYHNASAQTQPKTGPAPKERFERDTQTVQVTNQLQQVMVDAATQMTKNGCFINSRTDRIVSIRNVYETADEYHARILSKVILLQSSWRRWLAQVYVAGVRRDKQRRQEWERQEVARRHQERLDRAKREFERRMNPKTKTDFDLLFHALEVWRQEQLAYINTVCEGAERKAALCGLMEQEAELIASIGQHKIQADSRNNENGMMQFLNKVAAPHRWTAYDGLFTYMDTPYTMRAKQLRDIYASLTSHNHSRDERLDLLLTLKSTVKEHDCKLTREMVELIDREADLLVRGIKKDALSGLRKRLATMFFQYCKTPLFNPEVAKHIRVPQDLSLLTHNIHYCKSCRQYLPSTDFELSTNSKFIGHCRACRDLANQAHAREDWSTYREMLTELQEREERMQDDSQLVFLMQEADLCHLVENIWGGQSALSACVDTFELTTVRWDPRQQWSPWNCVVVTEDEAKSHVNLGDVTEAYGTHFVQKVKQRHILAKNYFSQISRLAEELRPKVKSLPLPRPTEKVFTVTMKDTVPPPHLREEQQH